MANSFLDAISADHERLSRLKELELASIWTQVMRLNTDLGYMQLDDTDSPASITHVICTDIVGWNWLWAVIHHHDTLAKLGMGDLLNVLNAAIEGEAALSSENEEFEPGLCAHFLQATVANLMDLYVMRCASNSCVALSVESEAGA